MRKFLRRTKRIELTPVPDEVLDSGEVRVAVGDYWAIRSSYASWKEDGDHWRYGVLAKTLVLIDLSDGVIVGTAPAATLQDRDPEPHFIRDRDQSGGRVVLAKASVPKGAEPASIVEWWDLQHRCLRLGLVKSRSKIYTYRHGQRK